jgi:diamine N-acetyltransferase
MIQILKADTKDISIIQHIANETWKVTYDDIMSAEQMTYMLDMMYADESLYRQIEEENHQFYFAVRGSEHLGFVAFQHNFEEGYTKLHKLYILPSAQGLGLGKLLTHHAISLAKSSRDKKMKLHVNRDNKAIQFYQRMGFKITDSMDVPIGGGYYMYDYVMVKELID